MKVALANAIAPRWANGWASAAGKPKRCLRYSNLNDTITYGNSGGRVHSPGRVIPYKDWFDSLDAQAAAKVATAKIRMELSNTSNVKWFAGIGEYVIDWGPGYRIYLAKDGDSLIVLFGGGTKRRQHADIDRAQALHAEYKARKAPVPDGNKAKKRKR